MKKIVSKKYILACAMVLLAVVLVVSIFVRGRLGDSENTSGAVPTDEVAATVDNVTEDATSDESNASSTTSTSAQSTEGDKVTTTQSGLPYLIKVNRKQNIVTVYTKDSSGNYTVPYKAMVCSVGLNDGTPLGTFQIYARYKWLSLYGDVYGQYSVRFKGPYLFHSVPYYTQNKGDLKYDEYNKLGSPASQGCVRLSVADAKWIYDNCASGTTVIIFESSAPEPLTPPAPIRIDRNSPNRGWDPTDPDSANPWKKAQTTTTTKATTSTTTAATTTTTTQAPTTTQSEITSETSTSDTSSNP